MLSRTADHVYWLGRYAERAENLARMLDVQYRLSLLPQSVQAVAAAWRATLVSLGLWEGYAEHHAEVEPRLATLYVALDRGHGGSIMSCLNAARENARAVRGAITSEMWETFNATWLEARAIDARRVSGGGVSEFIDWVKYRSQLTRGVMLGTMLRDEAYSFMRLGGFLERADGTARMLSTRIALSDNGTTAGATYYEWSVLLRAVSAFENYRKMFREAVTPERVAELLILRAENPFSLHRSMDEVCTNLALVANDQSRETERRAGELHSRLHFGRIEALADAGVGTFLDEFVARLADLDKRIAADFLVPAAR